MDVFELRDRLVADYAEYATSFINIRDDRIHERVEEELKSGLLWPEPLIQLNPTFEPGGYVDDLVQGGVLHRECADIFRIRAGEHDPGRPLRLHKHQTDAIHAAKTGGSYVLTTGTGSGKSLAYIVPIVDQVLREGSGKGIRAIIVYPMNALANSQLGELEKFLGREGDGYRPPVRFARYTGQESEERRTEIITDPPDILLTNYVMLELILTRPGERHIVERAEGLRFLVLDELHTYRGRQGADVALLTRRVREACRATDLQCVGTSATLAGPGTPEEQRVEVSRVATQLFGAPVEPTNVVTETLRRATEGRALEGPEFRKSLRRRIQETIRPDSMAYEEFVADPLSIWIESTFGVKEDPQTGRLERQPARQLTGPQGAARALTEAVDISEDDAAERIAAQLLAGYQIESPETGLPTFAFRLHQFISRGETVWASLEPEDERYITTGAQAFVPGDRGKVLRALAFCRECGQEYYVVRLVDPHGDEAGVPGRQLGDLDEEKGEAGYLYLSTANPWPMDAGGVIEKLPEDWLEQKNGAPVLKKGNRKLLPRHFIVSPAGVTAESGTSAWFVPAPFRFCLACGVSYAGQVRSDFGKLAELGTGGRATATTILALSLIRALRQDESLPATARKLLSFTDNRQDASLQAGHFNDFVEVGLLRSALYQATARAGAAGVSYDELAQRVFDALDLPLALYASDPGVKFAALEETRKAMRNVIGYRMYRDLERGWRVTSPNLEQVGLLRIEYASLTELCNDDEEWAAKHPALASAAPEVRECVGRVLLDHMRRELCIKVNYLQAETQEQLKQQSSVVLRSPWSIDDKEELRTASSLRPRSQRPHDYRGDVFLSGRSGFGQFLRRQTTFPGPERVSSVDDASTVISDLLETLRVAGLVEVVRETEGDVPAYQIKASALRWVAGDGKTGYHDVIRVPRPPEEGHRANPFFAEYYRTMAEDSKGIRAREHTAQVPAEIREEREVEFRKASLPVLFCSPTMELGVDIAELNAVNMRNVPPTPANYAQRSGRAGRSGQPALVFTYCATGSPHDQYFFRRPQVMVSGQVSPPRIDLANEDLVRAHVHAIWLSEIDLDLHHSLKDVLDLVGQRPSLAILPEVRWKFDARALEGATRRASEVLAAVREELLQTDWYTDEWLANVLRAAPLAFDQACERWRGLYRAALAQSTAQTKIIQDASHPYKDKKQAKRLRAEAESQLALLTAEDSRLMQSDFYSYRYFASEGFLPGYSFPRLPLSAYIPGRQIKGGRDEFLSRPRFLAISEFGPRSFVYHEGSRYIINRVILPVSEDAEEPVATGRAKQCDACGYLHPISGSAGPDVCERCAGALGAPIEGLFRMQNVSARRRDRITSDEEVRMRQGFEIRTGIRFVEHGGLPSSRAADVRAADGRSLFKLTYGPSATVWRANLGWRRSVRQGKQGFRLDVERGYWARNEASGEDLEDPMGPRVQTVVPYVEDHKNCLLIEPAQPLDAGRMASLQAALKSAVQVRFQLEDGELGVEPLPRLEDRRLILLYEAAEGGAGVLRRLLDDAGDLAQVARAALELCHFDPDTGQDLHKAPRARERCEAACYDCLMSYTNQLDHDKLDRHAIRDLLRDLAAATVVASPTSKSRKEMMAYMLTQCDSELERRWLRSIDDGGYRLPTGAQVVIESCGVKPDFVYAQEQTVVFIDGPHHNFEHTKSADVSKTACLEDMGYQVIRFGAEESWSDTWAKHPDVFGERAT